MASHSNENKRWIFTAWIFNIGTQDWNVSSTNFKQFLFLPFIGNEQEEDEEEEEEEEGEEEEEQEEDDNGDEEDDEEEVAEEKNLKKMEEQRSQGKVICQILFSLSLWFYFLVIFWNLYWLVSFPFSLYMSKWHLESWR